MLDRFEAPASERALIGGVALAVYGIERFTKDVDLAVTRRQSAAVETSLSDLDPRPLRIGGVSVATSHGVRIDFIDRRKNYEALFGAAIEAAQSESLRVQVGAHELAVVPLEYLVALKLVADRPQDEADLDRLLRLRPLNYRSARTLVEKYLGVFAAGRLDHLARAAGRVDAPRDYDSEYLD